jgi:hypothetical protein
MEKKRRRGAEEAGAVGFYANGKAGTATALYVSHA